MRIVLGIDVGTQSTRTFFYDADARACVHLATAPHDLIVREDGTRAQKAGWWIDALLQCLARAPASLKACVVAVGVSGQQHGFVPVGHDGEPLADVKLWCDTSTDDECRELTRAFGGEDRLVAEVGNPILPGYTASKILEFVQEDPERYERMRWVLLPHVFLNLWLTGEAAMECGDASGTGLLDVRRRSWHRELVRTVDPGLEDRLPRLLPPDEVAGRVRAEAAARTGLPAGIPVAAGGGDNMMGAIGTGCVRPGVLTLSMGTSATLYGYSDRPIVDPEGVLAAFCSSTGGWLPLLCTMNGTVASEQVRALFDLSLPEMDELAGEAPIGAEGVGMLPFFHGERVPNLPHGRASLMGLDATNFTRANVARAALESAVFGLRVGRERFQALGFEAQQIRMVGGGAKSPLWRQMAADVLASPVVVPVEAEAAALGAALQALWMHEGGGRARLETLVDEHVRLEGSLACAPDPTAVGAYDEAYDRYRTWLQALAPLYE